jgi:hypothetical protein
VSNYKLLINNELIGQAKSEHELVPANIKALACKDWEKNNKDLNGDSWSEDQDLNPELPKNQPFFYREPLKNSR